MNDLLEIPKIFYGTWKKCDWVNRKRKMHKIKYWFHFVKVPAKTFQNLQQISLNFALKIAIFIVFGIYTSPKSLGVSWQLESRNMSQPKKANQHIIVAKMHLYCKNFHSVKQTRFFRKKDRLFAHIRNFHL